MGTRDTGGELLIRLPLVIQASPTQLVAAIDGVPCRCWQAVTEDGAQILLWVHRAVGYDRAGEQALDTVLREERLPASIRVID